MKQIYFAKNFSLKQRISDEEVLKRFETIKPFVESQYTNQDRLFLMEAWENSPIRLLKKPISKVFSKEAVTTLSSRNFYDRYSRMCVCSVHVFGKPSEEVSYEDVVNSLPEEVLEKVTAFCIDGKVIFDENCNYYQKTKECNANLAFVTCYRDKIKLKYIDDKMLKKLSSKITVFKKDEESGKHYIVPKTSLSKMKETSYSFEFDIEGKEVADISKYKKMRDVEMLHTYSYPGFFKPSLYEIFSQIPEEIRDQVDAVEIVWSPQVANDFNKHLEAFNDGYHTSVVRLYQKKE